MCSEPAVQQCIWLHWKAFQFSSWQVMGRVRQVSDVIPLQGMKLGLQGLQQSGQRAEAAPVNIQPK